MLLPSSTILWIPWNNKPMIRTNKRGSKDNSKNRIGNCCVLICEIISCFVCEIKFILVVHVSLWHPKPSLGVENAFWSYMDLNDTKVKYNGAQSAILWL